MPVIRFERTEAIGHIILCNPPENLIALAFSKCLRQAVHEASESNIRALLIRAEGPHFSQGGDVADFIGRNVESFRTFVAQIHHTYRSIEALPIPTIAAVRGAAYGGAFELALACDFIVAGEQAEFWCLEASVGSAPLAGAVQRLAERTGRTIAARYAMLSERMSGVVAGQLGIASFVVPDEDVEGTATSLAMKLSAGPSRSYAAIRTLLKAWSAGGLQSADAIQLDVTLPLHGTEDAKRGRTARIEAINTGAALGPVIFEGR